MSEEKKQKKMLEDSKGNMSSKRITGVTMLSLGGALLLGIGIAAIFVIIKDPETALTAGKTLVYAGAGLLGIGVVEWFGGKKDE